PGQALIPIEALLMGKGHLALAGRWGQALDAVSAAVAGLPAQPGERELMALSRTMKTVTTLYQGEVASALDVPLGFSDADGD
ncbi:MAG TPA: peptidase M75, partial [Hydrogenophaga sp.]|nr:peptidase M75 [Hydrogenophaga sp.]